MEIIKLQNGRSLPEHKNLETLIISGNKIPEINDNFHYFPALKYLTLGSEETEFITMKLVQRIKAAKEIMKTNYLFHKFSFIHELTIDTDMNGGELYRKQLKLPPYSVLKSDSQTLSNYLKSPDVSLNKIANTDKIKSLNWLVSDCGKTMKTFSLADQNYMCAELRISDLGKDI